MSSSPAAETALITATPAPHQRQHQQQKVEGNRSAPALTVVLDVVNLVCLCLRHRWPHRLRAALGGKARRGSGQQRRRPLRQLSQTRQLQKLSVPASSHGRDATVVDRLGQVVHVLRRRQRASVLQECKVGRSVKLVAAGAAASPSPPASPQPRTLQTVFAIHLTAQGALMPSLPRKSATFFPAIDIVRCCCAASPLASDELRRAVPLLRDRRVFRGRRNLAE